MMQYFDVPKMEGSDFRYVFKFKKNDANFDKLWQMKTTARESLKDWLLVSDIPPKTAEVCANACSELIENSIKYSDEGSMAAVAIHVINNAITVETVNMANTTHCNELMHALAQLKSTSDLKEVFVEKLMNPVEDKSQLGLIKIALETKGFLDIIPHRHENVLHIILEINVH